MTGRHLGWLVAIAVFLLVVAVQGADQEQKPQPSDKSTVELLMQDKLKHAQAVLDGIVTEDYEKIVEQAKMMGLISRATTWHVLETREYRTLSERFQQTTANLANAALKGEEDGVALQYLQLTLSCIECHRYLRGQADN